MSVRRTHTTRMRRPPIIKSVIKMLHFLLCYSKSVLFHIVNFLLGLQIETKLIYNKFIPIFKFYSL